jgi:type IX secretion system PorP/SprF family membrane protein
MKKVFVLIIAVYSYSLTVNAQRLPESEQYLINRFALSPSYAGLNDIGVFAGFRKQWTDISGSPTSKFVNINGPLYNKKVGVGATIISDETDIFTHFYASLSYAYHLKIAENHMISFGLSAVAFQSSVDLTKIKLENPADPIILNKKSVSETVFNAGASLLYIFKGFNLGVSVPILFDSKSLYNRENKIDEYMLTRHYVGHASMDFNAGKSFMIVPYVIVKATDYSPLDYQVTAIVKYKKQVWLGGGVHSDKGHFSGIGISAGFILSNQFIMNYTYEFMGSGILGQSSGTHDINMGVYFGKEIKKLQDKQLTIEAKTDSVVTVSNNLKKDMAVVTKDMQQSKSDLQKNKNDHANFDSQIEILQQRLNDAELELGNVKSKYSGLELEKKNQDINKEIKDIESDLQDLGGQFFVIIESFKFKENAEKAIGLWKVKGIDATMVYNETRQWYYIFVGKFSTYEEASKLKAKLNEKNIQNWIYLWLDKKGTK